MNRKTTAVKTLEELLNAPKLAVDVTSHSIEVHETKRHGIGWSIQFDEKERFMCAFRTDLSPETIGTMVRSLTVVLRSLGLRTA